MVQEVSGRGSSNVGTELHALGDCSRGQQCKVEISVDMLDIFWEECITLGEDDGVGMHIDELMHHIHKLPMKKHKCIWKKLAIVMKTIDKAILAEKDRGPAVL